MNPSLHKIYARKANELLTESGLDTADLPSATQGLEAAGQLGSSPVEKQVKAHIGLAVQSCANLSEASERPSAEALAKANQLLADSGLDVADFPSFAEGLNAASKLGDSGIERQTKAYTGLMAGSLINQHQQAHAGKASAEIASQSHKSSGISR